MKTTRLLLRWGVWMCYTEWRPDQPHEDWSGCLAAEGGVLRNPHLVMYHGCWGAQRRTHIPLPEPKWRSPLLDFPRPLFGYKGVEGLVVEVEGDERTLLRFRTAMLDADFRLGDIPPGGWLCRPAGSKYSCSQLVVCRAEDEGVYWNPQRAAAEQQRTGRRRMELGLGDFRGTFVPREMHHRIAASIPPGGTLEAPFRWDACGPAIATWRFTGIFWAPLSEIHGSEVLQGGCNSPQVEFQTRLDGKELSSAHYKAKYMRGASSALEHTDELGTIAGEHVLSLTNLSRNWVYAALYGVTVEQMPAGWERTKKHLPFRAEWFDGKLPEGDASADIPSGGRGVLIGYDTNMMAAENGWIDAAIRFLAATGGGNYILFRTEADAVSEAGWRHWFASCRDAGVYFAINASLHKPALPVDRILALAGEVGGEYFIGRKNHEVSLPLYAGWTEVDFPPTRTMAEAQQAYLDYVRESYRGGGAVPRLLGEAALAHRYAYEAGVDLILSETMTGHTSLLLAEARGAAKAYGKKLWGMHIACHVHCSPEDERHERMFWLNLYLGYLSGASIIEDEEGGLAKVHSFVAGPSDPMPAARQKTIAEFFRWTRKHPRTTPLQVDVGFLYGRHEMLTGGMSLNTTRPVRVWERFGPTVPQWEYGRPEYGWLLMDVFLPGIWLCPVLQNLERLRRWFGGTPYGETDIVPIEASAECLSQYRLLVMPGWHTMEAEDIVRLTRFVEQGGTLVLGVPQLQTSADRTAVLSSPKWNLLQGETVERLCGLRLEGRGAACVGGEAMGQSWAFEHPQDGLLHLADVSLRGGKVALAVGGRPMVVENRIGAGRTVTFTAYEYFGHRGLLPLARRWLENLVTETPLEVRLEGGDGEVAYFVYPEGDRRRVFLINTDWTVPGNVKACKVISRSGASAEISVREGEVAEVVI